MGEKFEEKSLPYWFGWVEDREDQPILYGGLSKQIKRKEKNGEKQRTMATDYTQRRTDQIKGTFNPLRKKERIL